MAPTQKQVDAERAVHEALDAGDEATLAEFAEFAAGEIDDKHIAALLLSFMPCAKASRHPAIAAAMNQMEAINTLKHELDRQRAKFIEAYACVQIRKEDLSKMALAEINAEFREFNK